MWRGYSQVIPYSGWLYNTSILDSSVFVFFWKIQIITKNSYEIIAKRKSLKQLELFLDWLMWCVICRWLLIGDLPCEFGRWWAVPVPGGSRTERGAWCAFEIRSADSVHPARASKDTPGELPPNDRGPRDRARVCLTWWQAAGRGNFTVSLQFIFY